MRHILISHGEGEGHRRSPGKSRRHLILRFLLESVKNRSHLIGRRRNELDTLPLPQPSLRHGARVLVQVTQLQGRCVRGLLRPAREGIRNLPEHSGVLGSEDGREGNG